MMGYSPAAMAGVKANGRGWRKTVTGVREAVDALGAALDREDVDAANAALREIAKPFRAIWDEEKASPSETEALEWFEEESCRHEVENGEIYEFRANVDHYLNDLYDWADYHRVWVDTR
jgi:predicted lipid-binding transport protein (Tim44 family)